MRGYEAKAFARECSKAAVIWAEGRCVEPLVAVEGTKVKEARLTSEAAALTAEQTQKRHSRDCLPCRLGLGVGGNS